MQGKEQNPPLRAVVVGAGHFGKFHAGKYARLPGVELVGIIDPLPGAAAALCEQWGGRPYPSLEAMEEPFDLGSVATPAETHGALGAAILQRGGHLLVEKPIATNVADARKLIALAEEKKRVLQVNHQERYFLHEGGLPEALPGLKSIVVERLGPPPPRPSDCSVVLDILIHDLDWILAFLDRQPSGIEIAEAVRGGSGFIETVRAGLHFPGGVEVTLAGSRNQSERKRRAQLEGEGGAATVDFVSRTITDASGNDWYPPAEKSREALYGTHPFPPEDFVGKSLAHFIHCIRTGRRPLVDGRAGLRALETTLALEAACHSFVT